MKPYLLQLRIEFLKGLSQGIVQGIHRALTCCRGMFNMASHLYHDGRLAQCFLFLLPLLDNYAETDKIKESLVKTERLLHEEFKGRLGTFKLKSLVLKVL